MSFPAKVYRVLIGSPSDVEEERNVIPAALFDWNVRNGFDKKTIFLPTKWETDVVPLMGNRPQDSINKQIVLASDILIAVFGIRLGSPTGEAKSGTVEEINTFLAQNRPVIIYFSEKQLPPAEYRKNQDNINEVWAFRTECQKNGLIGTYESTDELKQKVGLHLSQMLAQFEQSDLTVPKTAYQAVAGSTPEVAADRRVGSKNVVGDFTVAPVIVDYSAKSILVKGNTVAYKDKFNEIGGKWNSSLKGWIFSKKRELEVRTLLGMVKE